MPTLLPAMLPLLAPFAPHFARRVWPHALTLVVGAILAPGRRAVAAAPRCVRQDAWYREPLPAFADALAVVRRRPWGPLALRTAADAGEVAHVPRAVLDRLTEALASAA